MWVAIQAFVLLVVVACLPARAYEMEFDIELETRLVCDTQKQVERFVEIFKGDVEAAVRSVNAEHEGPPACDMATIAYVPLDEISVVEGPRGKFRVIQIILMGVFTDDGFLFTMPATYFTMLPAEQKLLSGLQARNKNLVLRENASSSTGKLHPALRVAR